MTDAHDVAAYIISLATQTGEPVTNMKLQKLMYYSYAWYLVENDGKDRLFKEDIQAWKYGPVIKAIYEEYKGSKADNISEPLSGNTSSLTKDQKAIIEEVFFAYGKKSATDLVNITHSEVPWLETYEEGIDNKIIPDNLILKFFSEKKRQFSSN